MKESKTHEDEVSNVFSMVNIYRPFGGV